MGVFNSVSNWIETNREKKVQKMKDQGKCPDCRGRGFHPVLLDDYMLINAVDDYHCPGCNGSGLYSDWETQQQL